MDQELAQLMSIFEDLPVNKLKLYLNKYKTLENTIDYLLKPKNAFEMISFKQPAKITLNPDNISSYIPAILIKDFLKHDLANELLLDMLREAQEWHVRRFSLFGKSMNFRLILDVESPHTTAFYVDDSRKTFGNHVADSEYAGVPGQKANSRGFLPSMIKARNIVEEFVQGVLKNRNKHELELQGLWEANIVIANQYRNHEQGVGSHADRLTL